MVQRGIQRLKAKMASKQIKKAQRGGRGFQKVPYMVLRGLTWLIWVIQSKRAQIRTEQIYKLGHT